MGALYGFGTAFAVLLVWMAVGRLQDWARRANAAAEKADYFMQLVQGCNREIAEVRATGSSERVKDLVKRVDAIEETLAADRLEMLDISERIAHKLQDRQRKRDTAKNEIGEDGEEHDSYAARLARARAAYPLDPRQGSMFGDAP